MTYPVIPAPPSEAGAVQDRGTPPLPGGAGRPGVAARGPLAGIVDRGLPEVVGGAVGQLRDRQAGALDARGRGTVREVLTGAFVDVIAGDRRATRGGRGGTRPAHPG